LRGAAELERAVVNTRALGWEPVVGDHALARRGYFAGDDAQRLSDINRALGDDRVDGIWCLRGGYGTMRLLEDVDYAALRRRPKALLGFSDITALHAAVRACSRIVTFHAPTARGVLGTRSRESLSRAVVAQTNPCGVAPAARALRPGSARGVLAGGNLALLAALVGTPYAMPLDGAILVIEDIHEAVYRIDRMLRQLLLAGALRGIVAIAAGAFTDCPEESDDGARSVDEVLAETADTLGVPCLAGIPVGHIDDQWTLPLGRIAELDVEGRILSVEGK
jgi:muramoyltetrapeptide carboxypeptidase